MRPALCGVLALTAACAGSPAAPTPSTVLFSGTVTATNGGQPLVGAVIDVAGKQAITNSAGQFALETPTGRLALMISGAGLVPRVQSVNAGAVTVDAITQSGGFDLAFYRQFVRNGFESTTLEPVRRWTSNPVFTIATTDDRGRPVPTTTLALVQTTIANTVPPLTGNQFTAVFGPGGVQVRFLAAPSLTDHCGQATVGPGSGAFVEIYVDCDRMVYVAAHETGHVLGFWHASGAYPGLMGRYLLTPETVPSTRERYHAAIAYRRPVGNRDPDTDP